MNSKKSIKFHDAAKIHKVIRTIAFPSAMLTSVDDPFPRKNARTPQAY